MSPDDYPGRHADRLRLAARHLQDHADRRRAERDRWAARPWWLRRLIPQPSVDDLRTMHAQEWLSCRLASAADRLDECGALTEVGVGAMEHTTTARDRGMIFSAESVRAIRAGVKSQTRRVVKPQPPCECAYVINGAQSHALCYHEPTAPGGRWTDKTVIVPPTPTSTDHRLPCPLGAPGDRLWVRERWMYVGPGAGSGMDDWAREEMAKPENQVPASAWYAADFTDTAKLRWSSPLHMPRWASRLTLELVAVKVERLQDIGEADAIAEGAQTPGFPASLTNVGAFAKHWDTINGHRPGCAWSDSPWCWCLSFRVVPQPEAPR